MQIISYSCFSPMVVLSLGFGGAGGGWNVMNSGDLQHKA